MSVLNIIEDSWPGRWQGIHEDEGMWRLHLGDEYFVVVEVWGEQSVEGRIELGDHGETVPNTLISEFSKTGDPPVVKVLERLKGLAAIVQQANVALEKEHGKKSWVEFDMLDGWWNVMPMQPMREVTCEACSKTIGKGVQMWVFSRADGSKRSKFWRRCNEYRDVPPGESKDGQ